MDCHEEGRAHLPGHHRLGRREEVAVQGHTGPDHGSVVFSVVGLNQRRNIYLKITEMLLNVHVRNTICESKCSLRSHVCMV